MAITGADMTLPDALSFERAGLEAWPGTEVSWDGSWVRRAAGGYTKRANSLQCFDPADSADVKRRVADAVGWFRERNLPPVVRKTPLCSAELALSLNRDGWRETDESHLYAMPLNAGAEGEGEVTSVLDTVFLSAQARLQDYGERQLAAMRALLAAIKVPAAGIVIRRDGRVVASGLVAIANGIAMVGNVVTDPATRRRGNGRAIIQVGLSWAFRSGARVAALNVGADNAAAKTLYAGLGFTHQYDYGYLVPETE
jgi:ribosomal protein S18 acetylase RimI-like enzyme